MVNATIISVIKKPPYRIFVRDINSLHISTLGYYLARQTSDYYNSRGKYRVYNKSHDCSREKDYAGPHDESGEIHTIAVVCAVE